MKHLTEYVAASEKKYEYRIKVAGELETETYDKFKAALDMFDVETCTEPKKTPIQSDPLGFPELKNEEIHIFDIALNYPANNEQIAELARRSGIDRARLVVVGADWNDSMNKEAEGVEDGTRLETPEYPEPTKEQKEASEAYADSYKKAAAEFANEDATEFEIAGGKTKPAKYTSDEKMGTDSPLSKTSRQSIKDIMK
jgi:hypothetical protein